MRVIQSRLFAQRVGRFPAQEKTVLDAEIRKIIADPAIGQEKRGTLKDVRVHKFMIHSTLYLLAYRFADPATLALIMIGPHENYYRDLDGHLRNQG